MDLDVDAYGILEPPQSRHTVEVGRTLGISDRVIATTRSSVSVSGNGNDSAGRDVNKNVTYNIGDEALQKLAKARDREADGRGLQDPEALDRLSERYVRPPGLLDRHEDAAFRILLDRRVVMISADQMSGGQFAAGLMLGRELREHVSSEITVREELVDPELRFRAEDLLAEDEPTALLLDLRAAGQEDVQRVRRGLVEFAARLDHYRSFLILLIPTGQDRQFEEQLPRRVFRLPKPSGRAVFATHIDCGEDPDALVERSDAAEALANLWPPKAKELADWVSDRSRQDKSPDEALHEWLRKEQGGWSEDLRHKVRAHQEDDDAEWVSLLLSASLFEGASAKHIVEAADELLRHGGFNREMPIPLLQRSLVTRLSQLEDTNFDVATCRFEHHGFGAWALGHMWREHPGLHDPIQEWVGELPRKIRDLDRAELEEVADRATDLAVEGGHDIAIKLATSWASTNAGTRSKGVETSMHWSDRYRRSIAVRLLTTAATHSVLGKPVRQKLWEWSRDGSADLQLLTAEVCAGIGREFPRIAFVRLKHLANSENADVRNAVLAAVRQIADELGLPVFLRYVEEWFEDAAPQRLELLSRGVAQVLEDRPAEVDAESTSPFWRRALDTMTPDCLRPVVQNWLHASAKNAPDEQDQLLEPLIAATNGESRRIAQLYYASRPDFASLGESPVAELVPHLWTRLDEVDPVWR